ncbi:hypothetical protein SAMN06295967_113127 [Belliella buryatensis]|uniref:Phosphomannomutase n=1 Tax=Belliella buryatensis TaxID=1500549 RepID=A0A239FUK2_9BACT|nr:hypothetical protein [Belliella buryatensis]SNS60500.1 hypothetical protein SAMN06295967_113127 [Belliella buryatensis]
MSLESEIQQEQSNSFQNKVLLVSFEKQAALAKKLEKVAAVVGQFVVDQVSADRTFNFVTLKSAIEKAKEEGYNIVIAVDPEEDRITLVVKKGIAGAFMLLNVHQVAAVLLQEWIKSGKFEHMHLLKSILMSDLLDVVARKGRVETIDQVIEAGELRGAFKHINAALADHPVAAFNIDQQIIHSDLSFEEIVIQLASLEGEQGAREKTIYDALLEVYFYNGFYKEKAVALDLSIDTHKKQLSKFLSEVRRSPKFLEEIFSVSAVTDFNKGTKKNILTDKIYDHPIKGINILKIETVEGVSITLVPTEDKLTYYISVRESVNSPERFEMANKALDQEIFKLVSFLNRQI